MGQVAIQFQVTMADINCGECGGTYAINERYRAQKATDGGGWHCPYCQTAWGYSQNNENARLKRELEAERQRKIDALSRENLANAERERLERKLKRVNRGVCPSCNRSFQNLARHMQCKHKESA